MDGPLFVDTVSMDIPLFVDTVFMDSSLFVVTVSMDSPLFVSSLALRLSTRLSMRLAQTKALYEDRSEDLYETCSFGSLQGSLTPRLSTGLARSEDLYRAR